MFRQFFLAGAAGVAVIAAQPLAAQDTAPTVAAPPIEFTQWQLANGLTVIALPDPTTGNVTTSVWYDVGSAVVEASALIWALWVTQCHPHGFA